jgi:molecular chaperone DnaK
MRITPTSGLAPDEIDRLIQEATDFADTDRSAKEAVVLKNKLDSLLRNTKKSFTKFGGLLSQQDQDDAETIFREAETAVKTDKVEEINKALNRLERIAGQLTSAMLNPTPDATTSEV